MSEEAGAAAAPDAAAGVGGADDAGGGAVAEHVRMIEALLFASAEPVSGAAIQKRLPPELPATDILARLAADYRDRGVNLVQIGRGWAFRTAPDLADRLRMDVPVRRRLSRAAIETLAIIAYHQPVTRAEIEETRGVALSRGTLDTLLEAGWVRPRGRRQTPGRPLQWGTTDGFLDHFGLAALTDLPGLDELKAAGLLDQQRQVVHIGLPEDEADGLPEADAADLSEAGPEADDPAPW